MTGTLSATSRRYVLWATLGSGALVGGALIFQALGYPPCKLCHWQRWPHYAALIVGALTLWSGRRWLLPVGLVLMLVTAGLGIYHTGVERKLWLGPTTCTSTPIAGLSSDELLAQIQGAPLIRCDEVAWSLFGLSMASYNALFSLVLAGLWGAAGRRDQGAV